MHKLSVYPRKHGSKPLSWYWNLKAANGKKIANGGEGFNNRLDCIASAFGACRLTHDEYTVLLASNAVHLDRVNVLPSAATIAQEMQR